MSVPCTCSESCHRSVFVSLVELVLTSLLDYFLLETNDSGREISDLPHVGESVRVTESVAPRLPSHPYGRPNAAGFLAKVAAPNLSLLFHALLIHSIQPSYWGSVGELSDQGDFVQVGSFRPHPYWMSKHGDSVSCLNGIHEVTLSNWELE